MMESEVPPLPHPPAAGWSRVQSSVGPWRSPSSGAVRVGGSAGSGHTLLTGTDFDSVTGWVCFE